MTARSEREENAKKKVLLLVDAADANFPGNTEIEMTTRGHDPTARVVIPAYVLRSMLKDR